MAQLGGGSSNSSLARAESEDSLPRIDSSADLALLAKLAIPTPTLFKPIHSAYSSMNELAGMADEAEVPASNRLTNPIPNTNPNPNPSPWPSRNASHSSVLDDEEGLYLYSDRSTSGKGAGMVDIEEAALIDNEGKAGRASFAVAWASGSAAGSDSMAVYVAEKFTPLYVLGTGSFGTVWACEYSHETHTATYAVKYISKVAAEANSVARLRDEKTILMAVRGRDDAPSPFVLQFFGSAQTSDEVMFVTEMLHRGDLFRAIYDDEQQQGRMSHEVSQFYAAGIVLGLDHMHSRGIVYRDLKPENVAIDRQGYPKLIDLGLARQLRAGETCKTLCGTPDYVAPEIAFQGKGTVGYGCMVDLWSLGVVLYEMIMKRTPFAGKTPGDLTQLFTNIAHVMKCGIVLPEKLDCRAGNSRLARDLLMQVCQSYHTYRFLASSLTHY